MHRNPEIKLKTVQDVYNGPEGQLWELLMGQQIHIGGMVSSQDLADRAGITAGMTGIDLCCCNGAGCRWLVRFKEVAHMTGVDATVKVIRQAQKRTRAEGMTQRIDYVRRNVLTSKLPDGEAEFVWGEDAWCYVTGKKKLVDEAARLVKPGGTIAFTDWVEGPAGLTDAEAGRFLAFMKFPNVASIPTYRRLLEKAGCTVAVAEDTGRFPAYVDLYLNMVGMQLTSDALACIGYDMDLFGTIAGEMQFMQGLAHAGKICQGIFVARKSA